MGRNRKKEKEEGEEEGGEGNEENRRKWRDIICPHPLDEISDAPLTDITHPSVKVQG